MKVCIGCGETKPLKQFVSDKRGKDGRRGTCKECRNREVRSQRRISGPPAILVPYFGKVCTKCGEHKPDTEFYKKKTGLRGLNSRCKACCSSYQEEYHGINKGRRSETGREWRQSPQGRKLRDITLARRRAAKCGSTEVDAGISSEALRLRDGNDCSYCGCVLGFKSQKRVASSRATIDHVIPLSRGGTHTWGNVVLACSSCNSSKGSKLLGEWRPAA